MLLHLLEYYRLEFLHEILQFISHSMLPIYTTHSIHHYQLNTQHSQQKHELANICPDPGTLA